MSVAPMISLALSVALVAPAAEPRGYEGTVEAVEVQEEVEVPAPPVAAEPPPVVPEAPLEGPEDAPMGDDEPLDDEGDYADAYDPLRDSPEALRAASWVRSGIVFTAVGGLLTIGSILMARTLSDDPTAGNGGQDTARVRAAAALGIPGGLLLAGGVAMLAVGKVQQRRLRAGLSASTRGFGATVIVHF